MANLKQELQNVSKLKNNEEIINQLIQYQSMKSLPTSQSCSNFNSKNFLKNKNRKNRNKKTRSLSYINNHTHNQNKSGNKNGNLNNFRSLIFNKSLDNGYRKDRYKEIVSNFALDLRVNN